MIPKIDINVDGKPISVEPKLVRVAELCVEVGVKIQNSLFLVRNDGVKTPLEEDDYLIIHSDSNVKITSKGAKKARDDKASHCPMSCTFNQKSEEIKQPKILGKELREMDAELRSSKLYAVIDGAVSIDAAVEDDFQIVLHGGEKFITIPTDAENEGIIDMEKCAKSGRCPPRSRKYRIKIGGEYTEIDKWEISGKEILELAKTPLEGYALRKKFPGGQRESIKITTVVSLVDVCIERFETTKISATEGEASV